jgi:sulfur carrier protein
MDIGSQEDLLSVTLNGTPQRVAGPMSIAQLIEHNGLAGKRIAVEVNGQIVPRSRLSEVRLSDGDRLEVVVAVGGG